MDVFLLLFSAPEKVRKPLMSRSFEVRNMFLHPHFFTKKKEVCPCRWKLPKKPTDIFPHNNYSAAEVHHLVSYLRSSFTQIRSLHRYLSYFFILYGLAAFKKKEYVKIGCLRVITGGISLIIHLVKSSGNPLSLKLIFCCSLNCHTISRFGLI